MGDSLRGVTAAPPARARRRLRPALLVIAAAVIGGCGSTSLDNTIDADKLKDMSRQGQLWVFDAENGIVVALDRLDEARDELYRILRELKVAERRIEAAEKRRKRLLVDVAEAWEKHLESLERWARANVRVERFGVLVARATVELAKAQVIQREDLLAGKDFDVKTYQEQYQELREEYLRRKKIVRKMRQRARKLEARWRSLRRRYVAQTGDYDSGLWID